MRKSRKGSRVILKDDFNKICNKIDKIQTLALDSIDLKDNHKQLNDIAYLIDDIKKLLGLQPRVIFPEVLDESEL